MKLYTDFDKLQFELKKCFRFDKLKNVKYPQKEHEYVPENSSYRKSEDESKQRLQQFYYWRCMSLCLFISYSKSMSIIFL